MQVSVPEYKCVCFSDLYSGQWIVVRMNDLRLVFNASTPNECGRWINTWGPVEFSKPGSELSPKVIERMGWA